MNPGNGMRSLWIPASSADPLLGTMYERHYSCRTKHRRRNPRFVGPGECMVLRTLAWDAMWVWRFSRYRQDGRKGVECSVFRNEGPCLASDLIREATAWGRERWPHERLFTFVNPARIRSPRPGACFRIAGWQRVPGTTSRGLLELEAPMDRPAQSGYDARRATTGQAGHRKEEQWPTKR